MVSWTRQKLRTPMISVLLTFRIWGEQQQRSGEWDWSQWDHFHGKEYRELSSKRLKMVMSTITGIDDIEWWAAAEAACELFGFDPIQLPRT